MGAIVHRAGPPLAPSDRIIFDGTALAGEQKATVANEAGLNGSAGSLSRQDGARGERPVRLGRDRCLLKTVRSPKAPTNLDPAAVAAGKQLFDANHCAACHGGSHWTIASVFYTPNDANGAATGVLRTVEYTRPDSFPVALNPPSASGKAPLRFNGLNPGADDQINCVLRDVGTFPRTGTMGIGSVAINEVRQDMITRAQGQTGFNIPSRPAGLVPALHRRVDGAPARAQPGLPVRPLRPDPRGNSEVSDISAGDLSPLPGGASMMTTSSPTTRSWRLK